MDSWPLAQCTRHLDQAGKVAVCLIGSVPFRPFGSLAQRGRVLPRYRVPDSNNLPAALCSAGQQTYCALMRVWCRDSRGTDGSPSGTRNGPPVQSPCTTFMIQHRLSPGEPIARRAAALASELKATNLVVLDLRGVTDMTDFFVIASGTSDTHVRAVASHVLEGLREAGVSTKFTEGFDQGRWALLDYLDCVVHVFHPAQRQFFQLERLWGDARSVDLDEEGTGGTQ